MSVSYNFPSNAVINTPKNMFNGVSTIASSSSPTANFAYKSINYFANQVFVFTDNSIKYFVIQSGTDTNIDTKGNFYVAIPLGDSDSGKNKSTDIEKLITAANANPASSPINLNSVFSTLLGTTNGSNGKIVQDRSNPNNKCFFANNSLGVAFPTGVVLQSNPMENIALSSEERTEASLVQSYIGWDMSCVLLDEDGREYENPTTTTIAAGTDNAYTLVLMTLVIMVVSSIYILAPIVYPYLFEGALTIDPGMTDSAFNMFWFIILFLGAIPPIVLGATSQKAPYFLFALTYGLSYFAGTAGVVKSINNAKRVKDGAFVTDDKLPANVLKLFLDGRPSDNIAFSVIFLVILFIGFILAYIGMGLGSNSTDGQNCYAVGSIMYIIAAIGKFIILRVFKTYYG